jgi:signal transduction histidine kinase
MADRDERAVAFGAINDRDVVERGFESAVALLDPTAILRSAAANVARLDDVDVGFVGAVIDNVDTLRLDAFTGTRTEALFDLVVPAGTGLGGKAAVLRQPQWVADYCASPTITHDFDSYVRAEGLRAVLAVPAMSGHRFLAVVYASRRVSVGFSDRDLDRIAGIARQTAFALDVAGHAEEAVTVAVAEERQRLGAELHDSVGASLFSIRAAARALRSALAGDTTLAPRLADIEEQASRAAADLRAALRALHEPPTSMELAVASQRYCRAFTRRTGVVAASYVLNDLPPLAPQRVDALLACIREALVNIEKHATPTSVAVTLSESDAGVAATITNDGSQGLCADRQADGIGVVATRRALEAVGGRLSLSFEDDGSCIVRGWVPC